MHYVARLPITYTTQGWTFRGSNPIGGEVFGTHSDRPTKTQLHFSCRHISISLTSIIGVPDSMVIFYCLPPNWILCSRFSPFFFFFKNLTNAECMINSWPVTLNSTLMIPSTFLCVWRSPWQQHFGLNFECIWQECCATIVTTACFVTLLINRYDDRLFALLWQLLFIPRRINKLINLKSICVSPALRNFAELW